MSFKIFTWIDELFDGFSRTNSYRLEADQKQIVMRGLRWLLITGVGLGLVLGLILFGFGIIEY
ncbi:hypothetical protein HNQ80_002992 [Anaerosolibacter carboniphilus]|uniref:Uncharacterized protein n=1 Tax=Anaerosolibacter carboniphilus TaxID=1417629 RepID=A0A841KU05_9FIRM|nr:hypothetical protein [Anaerosolibacter carboniphilus]MBB6216887.1 hypothetical protein [Anaerosolibacter carboniphilus]